MQPIQSSELFTPLKESAFKESQSNWRDPDFKSIRERALAWWRNMSKPQQKILCKKHCPIKYQQLGLNAISMSSSWVEVLYRKEFNVQ